MSQQNYNLLVPNPEQFGFCEGVVAADDFLRKISSIAREFKLPVFGYHDIVHNDAVRRTHEEQGVVFVKEPDEVPERSVVVGSAHGTSPLVISEFESQGSLFFDGACPLVVHTLKAVQQARQHTGEKVLYLLSGKPGGVHKLHDEVAGTIGHMDYRYAGYGEAAYEPVDRAFFELSDPLEQVEDVLTDSKRYRIVGQTTLLATATIAFRENLAAAIKQAQPDAIVARIDRRDVCFAVEERQEGVRVLLAKKPDSIVVVTDPNSKNGMGYVSLAKRITEAQGLKTAVVAVRDADDLTQHKDLLGETIAITASASTPDTDTRQVVVELGGDPSKVPIARPSFNLRNSNDQDIRRLIQDWRKQWN